VRPGMQESSMSPRTTFHFSGRERERNSGGKGGKDRVPKPETEKAPFNKEETTRGRGVRKLSGSYDSKLSLRGERYEIHVKRLAIS